MNLHTNELENVLFHEGCADQWCPTCWDASNVLEQTLYELLHRSVDHEGRYHSWLKTQGIPPETEGGWWSKDALNAENVRRYVNEWIAEES